MPCNSDHLEPSQYEIEASRIHALLDELAGESISTHAFQNRWDGYHPLAYCKGITKTDMDNLTAKLCEELHKVDDITKYSLEMQMWWRDHLREDEAKRIREERVAIRGKKILNALAKLTREEKILLELVK